MWKQFTNKTLSPTAVKTSAPSGLCRACILSVRLNKKCFHQATQTSFPFPFLFLSREAARECRRKKKEYVKCLENRVAVLENQNKTLIEELKALKDIYCHKAE